MRTRSLRLILASTSNRLYIGVTTNIERRLHQHGMGTFSDSFARRYNMHRLVHSSASPSITAAIAREKQLKRWSRARKCDLVTASNRAWLDLSEAWGKPLRRHGATTANHLVS